MAEDEKAKKRKQGGIKTMPFILANEICDRFATTGFSSNMITYLTQQLHMPLVQASNTLSNFSGTSSLTPIIGALMADSYVGRFWTITIGSLIYQLGMISLTITAILPSMRPPPCNPNSHATCKQATSTQLLILYISLLCTSIGSGGIRPCVMPFGADQFGLHQPRAAARRSNFFNLYYFCMGLAVLLALTLVVYIQENVGWGWGLGIPTMAMFCSVVTFVVGYPLYIKMKPGGSPMTRVAQVFVAAVKKRKIVKPSEAELMLYEDKELDADISTTGRLLHTNQLMFLDRAAIKTPSDILPSGQPNLWRLATVHRVEEVKSVIRLLPIWSVGILMATSHSHIHSFVIQQARSMNRHLSPHFEIPPATLSIFTNITMLVSLAIYDRAFVPLARRITGRPSGITYFQRMGIGLAIGIAANVVAALVESKRKAVAAQHGMLDELNSVLPISVMWLVPQYAIHGLGEAFSAVGHMEFLYDQAPESMRSTAAALFWLAISIGSYMGTVLVTVVHDLSKGSGDWLQDNINRGKLDYYYWLVSGLQMLNLVYFVVCTKFYTLKPLEVAEDVKEDGVDAKAVRVEEEAIETEKINGGNLEMVEKV